jgi:hypothetical protein
VFLVVRIIGRTRVQYSRWHTRRHFIGCPCHILLSEPVEKYFILTLDPRTQMDRYGPSGGTRRFSHSSPVPISYLKNCARPQDSWPFGTHCMLFPICSNSPHMSRLQVFYLRFFVLTPKGTTNGIRYTCSMLIPSMLSMFRTHSNSLKFCQILYLLIFCWRATALHVRILQVIWTLGLPVLTQWVWLSTAG